MQTIVLTLLNSLQNKRNHLLLRSLSRRLSHHRKFERINPIVGQRWSICFNGHVPDKIQTLNQIYLQPFNVCWPSQFATLHFKFCLQSMRRKKTKSLNLFLPSQNVVNPYKFQQLSLPSWNMKFPWCVKTLIRFFNQIRIFSPAVFMLQCSTPTLKLDFPRSQHVGLAEFLYLCSEGDAVEWNLKFCAISLQFWMKYVAGLSCDWGLKACNVFDFPILRFPLMIFQHNNHSLLQQSFPSGYICD